MTWMTKKMKKVMKISISINEFEFCCFEFLSSRHVVFVLGAQDLAERIADQRQTVKYNFFCANSKSKNADCFQGPGVSRFLR